MKIAYIQQLLYSCYVTIKAKKEFVYDEKGFVSIFLLLSVVFAKKEDYSEMSTQELIEIIGYIKEQNKESF
ncbi:MAG: hypothetical protein H6630_00360 [Arcobacter sp.]|nr:hypothetical protein [Arcobacter sp.]